MPKYNLTVHLNEEGALLLEEQVRALGSMIAKLPPENTLWGLYYFMATLLADLDDQGFKGVELPIE